MYEQASAIPHQFHHAVHINNLLVITFEDLSPRWTLVTEPRTKLLKVCHLTAHVVNIRKKAGKRDKYTILESKRVKSYVIYIRQGIWKYNKKEVTDLITPRKGPWHIFLRYAKKKLLIDPNNSLRDYEMVLCPQSALKPSAFTPSSARLCLPKLMQHILGAEAKHIILISVFLSWATISAV